MARKQKKYHYIYKTTNLVNKKYYIGMHSTDNLEDGYVGSGKRLWYSIKKYGKENFKCEILEMLPDRFSLKEREKEVVNESILKEKMCMNLKLGGDGGFVDDEHKKKFHRNGGISTIHLLKMYADEHLKKMKTDDEYRKKFSNIFKGNRNWVGKHHTEESKRKIGNANSLIQKGSNNSQYGTRWITNGNENKKIKKEEQIPNGWRLGRQLKNF
jgi:hypothetical protein